SGLSELAPTLLHFAPHSYGKARSDRNTGASVPAVSAESRGYLSVGREWREMGRFAHKPRRDWAFRLGHPGRPPSTNGAGSVHQGMKKPGCVASGFLVGAGVSGPPGADPIGRS